MNSFMVLQLVVVGIAAGGFGALAGVGGGVIIIPLLTLYLHVPIHHAIGISLAAVIATSTATSSVNVERHITDIRLGMTLELATTLGAAIAAVVAGYMNRMTLAILFVAFLLYSASTLIRRAWSSRSEKIVLEIPAYTPKRYGLGLTASVIAGGFSGLLGVGGGVIKVPLMYLLMGIPLRVATATSNFMIGVTAAASAYIYYARGDVAVDIAAPLVAGVFSGSLIGARLAPRVHAKHVLAAFIAITVFLAIQMIVRLAKGGF